MVDLRTLRKGPDRREDVKFCFSLKDIALAAKVSINVVLMDKHRERFDPGDLRSVSLYIAKRILLKFLR